ncbi:porin family protein [Psychroflexus salis]|uniref:Outer membrane protein beta-barrel domain-containing protein n=1 Tax=Psychroflexus salis TaxID=1526574 RepID=A0A917A007_9FLAO|nr:porin family protein [Psychroflexus salis]GGE18717.1 hypothetical protein GCM10010831_19850 [Psychroflexus salis]
MKFFYSIFFFVIAFFACFSQTDERVLNLDETDSLYREDQFYFGFHINLLHNLPEGINQSGLSGGIMGGFIRDMPINKRRNWAIGLGLGVSANTYGSNLFIGKNESGEGVFQILDRDEVEYSTNRFSTYIAEVPVQLRWRTSTPTKSSFYRIYAGFTFGYLYHFRSRFEGNESTLKYSSLSELNRIRTGLHLSFGSNFVNFHIQYNFNTLFDAQIADTNTNLDFQIFKFGFIFYML